MSNVNPASAETIRLRAALAAAEARADEAESYSNADTETAAQFATRAFAAEAERDQLRGELREVRDQLAAAIAEHTERRENGWFTGECEDCGYPWHRSRGGCTARQHLIRFRDALSSPSTFTLNATQPGVDEHSDSRNATPVTPEPAEPERRTAICGHEDFAQGFCVVDGCANDLHKRGPSSAATPAEPEQKDGAE